jgi:hypothetical protein
MHVPFGCGKTLKFITGLWHERIGAQWMNNGAVNGVSFLVEQI